MAQSPYTRFGRSVIGGTRAIERQHTVVAGDTIPKIAAYYEPDLGYNADYWRQVAEANLVDDLDALTIGTVLVVPTPKPTDT